MESPLKTTQIYDAPIERVWQALTDENQMRIWYFPALKHFEATVGSEFQFTDDGSPYQKQWRVTRAVPGKLLAHSWAYQDHPGNSEVIFELFEEGSKTRLSLTHTGLASFPDDPHFARKRFEDGWQQLLGTNLKDLLEQEK